MDNRTKKVATFAIAPGFIIYLFSLGVVSNLCTALCMGAFLWVIIHSTEHNV